jgi:rubrerythrin
MHTASLRSSLNLCALFATLLSGCAVRLIDTDSDSATEGEGSSSATDFTTSATDGEITTTETPATTSTSTSTSTTTTDTGPATVTTDPTIDPGCDGTSHVVELPKEEYEHWLEHGTPLPQGETTGGGEPPDGTTTEAMQTTGDVPPESTTTEAMQTTGETGGETTGGGILTEELCRAICAHESGAVLEDITYCEKWQDKDDGIVRIYCEEGQICEGRRHACIQSRGAEIGDDPVGAWFARAAHDEEASVFAFVALERELADHGAPAELLARLRDAAADEVRHARAATALARRHGGRVQRPRRAATETRSLLAIARENAAEGCVRETWAALSAAHQARSAADPEIRAAMAAIAEDEARHAELAWALDAWLQTVLSDSAWGEVEAARRDAADELTRFLARHEHDAALIRRAGVPDRAAARALSAGLRDALWSAAA